MKLRGYDVAAFAWLGLMTLLVLIFRPPGALLYLLGHAVAGVVVAAAIAGDARWPTPAWRIARIWYIVPFILCAFRELHYLVPHVHSFDDARYDRILGDLDRRWLGDVDGFFLGLVTPAAADVLHLCYWSYYVSLVILGAQLHRRGEWERLHEYATVVLVALLLSYAGYFLVPAVGPHHFYPSRPAVLDGWLIGGGLHRTMQALELRMPDAFPSGHTLMSLVLVFLAKRHGSARTLWVVVPTAAGCILATVALRYHYVVDVLASFALFPAAIWLALSLDRRLRPAPPQL